MKVILTKEKLLDAVSATSVILSGKSTLPILDMILLESENGISTFRSTDLEKTVKYTTGGDVESGGKAVVDGKTLKGVIESSPAKDKKITLETVGAKLKISSESFEVSLNMGEVEDFPDFSNIQKDYFFNVNLESFLSSIDEVMFSATNDMARPILGSVYFDLIDEGNLVMVTTDSYRLSRTSVKILSAGGEKKNLIIPVRSLKDLKTIFGKVKKESNLEIKVSGSQIEFAAEGVSVTARLLDGDYPDYNQVIPKEFKTEIVVPKEDLINSCKLSSFFYENISITNLKIDVEKKQVIISSTGKKGEGNLTLKPGIITGENVELFLNSRYLLDALRAINTEDVKMVFNGKFPPCKLSEPSGEERKFYIIMPLKE
jgi:DNA polymerase III subunit beta